MTLREAPRALYRAFDEMDTVDVVTRLTLIAILVSDHVAGSEWIFKCGTRSLAFVALLVPPLHRSWLLWLGMTLVFACRTGVDWWFQDNHLFLFTYWSLTLTLALRLAEPARAFATSGRLMIGLSFAFATLWKGFLSPDYMDGSYFHFTMLADPRFHDLASTVGRVPDATFAANRAAFGLLNGWQPDVETVALASTSIMPVLSWAMTWWTVGIEGLLGLAFLWPGSGGPARLRNGALLLFGWTTYTVATVPTFGWILMTMGAAQCRRDERLSRFLYAITCLVILLYSYVVILSLVRPFLAP